MTQNSPAAISRTFRDLSDKELAEAETASLLSHWGVSRGVRWDDLLKSPRVLIMSEAGVGKTFECRACRDRLMANGEPAFVLELSTLADVDVRDMLEAQEQARFDTWLRAQSETATFFLDSIDELQISQKSFEQALKRLNRAIVGHLGRARIVITTRPIPVDQQLIEKHLPIPRAAETVATAEAFADVAMSRQRRQKNNAAEPKNWRNVGLMGLSTDEIKEFARGQDVTDPEALLADIQRRHAEEYAQRPQDLIELCSDWKEHQRIRSHRDQVSTNATTKLKPRTDRPEKAELSVDRALEGASRLALAALLSRRLTIRYSAESDRIQSNEAALDTSKILTDWPQKERDTLLERGLFGFANYGRVRFHHRSVVEYLSAMRLDALLRRRVPISAVKRVLFAETTQGEKAVRPSMRSVAAWLSISHDAIFAEVLEREPEVLLDYGDPQSLSAAQRAEVLKAYVNRYGKGGWRGLHVPAVQVHRFASLELSQTVKAMWASIENSEVRDLIFAIIGAGKLTDCADIPHTLAVNGHASPRERLNALDALIALSDGRLAAISASIEEDTALWPTDIARTASIRLFPKYLSVPQICSILARVEEPKDTIGELRWKLPQLIADSDFTPDALDALRSRLSALVIGGAEWRQDKWPNTRTKRPDLVSALIAACIQQFRGGITAPDLFRSSVLALRFTTDEHSSEQPIKDLRSFLATAPSERRETAFWADDAFLQSLHPIKDAWGRVFHLSHYGGIRLTPEKDRGWVIRRLADKRNSSAEREMMLYAAMIELVRPGDDVMRVHEDLKLYVEDSASLLTIIESRMKPPPGSEEMRRLEQESERRKRQSQTGDAKARASWVEFWREIERNPEAVFGEARADKTAWNLWQAMERSGRESRASGWNRRFIEEQFGSEIADRLRETLKRMWRKDKPTLRSERPVDKRNTFLVRWQLGLAAIYAEAEDQNWATKLTDEEARLAARYAPIELNGFPSWLDALVAAHPKAVDAVLGEELSLSLGDTLEESTASMALQNVRHASPRVGALFVSRIRAWMDETRGGRSGNDASSEGRLSQAVDFLMQSDDPSIRKTMEDIAVEELAKDLLSPFAKVWMPVLMQLNPEVGVGALEAGLKAIPPGERGVGVEWFSSLFGHDHRGATVDLRRSEFSPKLLLRLVRLAYQHVRPVDDAQRESSYTPDERDDAERGRDTVLSALLATTGTEGWSAKLEMANDPLFAHFRDRAIAIARERAAEEVDGAALSYGEFVILDAYGEAPPTTRGAMFAVMRDRLDDIDDMLLHDTSHRETWATITEERLMRREIARELHLNANHVYTVDQEAATAEEKETDIRMRSAASAQQATIELKIGEKDRSAAVLRATLKDQLLTKYMAADDCRSGCLVITIASDKTWRHPDSNKPIDFAGLIEVLNQEANRLSLELGSVRMMVKGYDLRPRLKTEREEAKPKKSRLTAQAK